MNEANVMELLLGLVGVLVTIAGLNVWITKLVIARSDKHINRLLDGFDKAIERFAAFELEEKQTHSSLIFTQQRMLSEMERMTTAMDRLVDKVAHMDGKINQIAEK